MKSFADCVGRVWRFYRDGFRAMTVGRTLWVIILIKIFIILVVLRLWLFPRSESRYEFRDAQPDPLTEQALQQPK